MLPLILGTYGHRNSLLTASQPLTLIVPSSLISGYFHLKRHQTREADPKDYDIQGSNPEGKCLHRSTYNRIGNVTLGVRKFLTKFNAYIPTQKSKYFKTEYNNIKIVRY